MMLNLTALELDTLNQTFEAQSPEGILKWSWATFGLQAMASSSFQPQSIVLLHMISIICPEMPIVFNDTGYHFPETLTFRDEIVHTLKLNVQTVYADPESQQQLENSVEPLHLRNPDLCCRINKVEPMAKALRDKQAWITGIRREQTKTRSQISIVEVRSDGLFKISPLANWLRHEVWNYIDRYALPVHPLFSKGFASIGCAPCTRALHAGEDDRAGRWAGTEKIECGLHTLIVPVNEMIDSKL